MRLYTSMKRPPLPCLLLLPLLAVLLFGNCGLTSIRQALREMNSDNRAALRASVAQRQAAREAARQQLHGAARQEAFERIEQVANQQADSIRNVGAGFNQSKFHTRRNKFERQLLRDYPAPPSK